MDTRAAAVRTVRSIARAGARAAIEASLGSHPYEERELDAEHDLSFDHWVTAIMLSSRVFKFSFSARFTSRVARALAAAALGQKLEDVRPTIAHDNMGEFCNLSVGTAQRSLAEMHASFTDTLMTTPHATPSFDLGTEELRALGSYGDKWLLAFGEHAFLCSFTVDVSDWNVFSRLKDADISKLSVSDGGDLVFF